MSAAVRNLLSFAKLVLKFQVHYMYDKFGLSRLDIEAS